MKKLLLLVLSISLWTLSLSAQNWVDLGFSTPIGSFSQSPSFDVDNGKVYVVENMPTSSIPNEMRLNVLSASGWDSVSSLSNAWIPKMDVINGVPKVAYTNLSNFNASVSKYENNIWSIVGNPAGISTTFTFFDGDIVNDNGNIFVMFFEGNLANQIKVLKYNGTSWSIIGNQGFANVTQSSSSVNSSLAVYNGTPYVAFSDANTANKTTVMKYISNLGWVEVGNVVGISSGGASLQAIEIDNLGVPYVAYVDSMQQNKVTVQKFNGTNWVLEGLAGTASAGSIEFLDFGINSVNEPFVAYVDSSTNKTNVKKFDGNNWVNVGDPNFSPNTVSGNMLAFNGAIPYVAFREGTRTRVMVYCFQTSSSINEIACSSYTSPSGNYTWTASGTYMDTIANSNFCDSVITINLTIQSNTGSFENVTECGSYTWPVNNVTYTTSGVYTDTLLSSINCDSILTLNLTINNSSSSTETVGACDTYTWAANNQTYTSTGVYTATIPNSTGCDSNMTLNLTISSASTSSTSVTECDSYTWAANNLTYFASGTFTETILNSVGCDSTITLNLTINNSSGSSETVNACESYRWPVNSVTYINSGVYTATILNSVGCDSVLVLDLTINNSTSFTETVGACDTYTWAANNQTYTSNGIYTTTIPNSAGCDSNMTLNLTINSASTSSTSVTECDSYTWDANNQTYTTNGSYTETILNSVGCDSTITLNLTIYNSSASSETVTACDSYSWAANAVTYTTSGIYTFTTLNSVGCDSVLTLDLTINNSTSSTETVGACDTYTWAANNQTYTSSGVYTTTIPNSAGCDSNMTLNLTISSASTSSTSVTECDSYTWDANNQTYTASGSYTETILNSVGCDSTITLNLTIYNSSVSSETVTACDSYSWAANAVTYTTSGIYTFTTLNSVGCDSVLTLDLTINNSTSFTETLGACDTYTWAANNQTYTSSGVYTTTIPNSAGCDSNMTLNLTISSASTSSTSVTECDSYTWDANNQTYTASGTFTETILNSFGCDSTITLDLTILNSSASSETVTACDSYTWAANAVTYTTSGIYTATILNSDGCDSVLTLDLTINTSSSSSSIVGACDIYVWEVNNQVFTFTSSGTYTATIPNTAGCDSVLTLNLTIGTADSSSVSVTECDAYTWAFNNQTYTNSGSYSETILNSFGCDSTITLDLTILNSSTSTETATACDTYDWALNNVTYTQSGMYSFVLPNSNGCDSTIVLDLTINNSSVSFDTIQACESYTWPVNNTTYTIGGTFTETIPNSSGCDSTITLKLTINTSNGSTKNITECDSFTWEADNNTYTESGTYTTTLINSNGCDSVVVLNLVINNSNGSTEDQVACDSYLWPANNTTYTASGTYTANLTNINGCDSTAILNLIINNSNSSLETIVACDSFTWSANNTTYLQSGTYTENLINSTGCDSTVTLVLEINNSNSSTETISACDAYTWSVNNETYNSSGIYTEVLTNENGCDSTVTLALTINSSYSNTDTIVSCDSYTWGVNNTAYTSSGIYTDTFMSSTGCDSILTLDLTINNSSSSEVQQSACGSFTWAVNNTTYNSSGMYSEVLTNINGCDSIIILDLNIQNEIDTSIDQAGNNLTSNDSTVGNAFQWIDCNNNNAVIPNETGNSFTATSNGSYALVIENGVCVDTTACIELVNVGVLNNIYNLDIVIYPNPTSNQLIIQQGNFEIEEITIIDVTGASILTIVKGSNVIDVSSLSSGSYFLKVQSNKGSSLSSFIKH